jgi:putative endonuclease
MPFTYIVRCSDDSFYVGSTWNLQRRLWQHNHGEGSAYTARRRPVVLEWAAEFERIDEAFALEKQIQNWSRAKRQALIGGPYTDLPRLSRTLPAQLQLVALSGLDKLDHRGGPVQRCPARRRLAAPPLTSDETSTPDGVSTSSTTAEAARQCRAEPCLYWAKDSFQSP